MLVSELVEHYEAVRSDDGTEYPMTPAGEAAWDAKLEAFERAIPAAIPRSMTDALALLRMVERMIEAGEADTKSDLLVPMLSNCRQAIADLHWR